MKDQVAKVFGALSVLAVRSIAVVLIEALAGCGGASLDPPTAPTVNAPPAISILLPPVIRLGQSTRVPLTMTGTPAPTVGCLEMHRQFMGVIGVFQRGAGCGGG